MYRARPFRERCGLAEAGAPGGLEFRAQPLVFAAQSLPVALELLQFRAQSDYLFGLMLDQIVGAFRPVGHVTVMPKLSIQYKSNHTGTR